MLLISTIQLLLVDTGAVNKVSAGATCWAEYVTFQYVRVSFVALYVPSPD